ncbi:MAG: DUF2254 domain-containing protein [Chloroflexota bacterium]
MLRFQRVFNNLQGGLWFVPSLVVALLIGLAYLMVWLDRTVGNSVAANLPLVFEAGPEGTRDMLSTIAGSMLTVASVAFSFTIVVFSFASSQYASRTLHSFMDDNTNQIVLGTLLGSFVYCLLILRTTRIENDQDFVPVLSATFALLLAIVDLMLFILFIHHVSESIQAYHIINRVGQATNKAIIGLYPEHMQRRDAQDDSDERVAAFEMSEVLAGQSGYIQMVYGRQLLDMAVRHDLVVVLHKSVGNFVLKNELLATVGPADRVSDDLVRQIRDAFASGPHRTIYQDPLYGMLQLSDIAIKALSPAINDPNTAVMALNEMSLVLRQLAARELPRHVLLDKNGQARIIAPVLTFDAMAAHAFDQVRRYGMGDATIPAKMLDVIAEIAERCDLPGQRAVLKEHVKAIMRDADRHIENERDRAQINAEMADVVGALGIHEGEISLL